MERTISMPEIPKEEVRKVLNTQYLFSEVVRELAHGSVASLLGMSAVRDALLYQMDQMIQEDEANRFSVLSQAVPAPQVPLRQECMYFVKN